MYLPQVQCNMLIATDIYERDSQHNVHLMTFCLSYLQVY